MTRDIGLASTPLLKGVFVLSPKGISYDEKDIHTALDMKYYQQKSDEGGYTERPQALSRKFERGL